MTTRLKEAITNNAISNILDPKTFVKVMYIDTGMNSADLFVSVFTKMIKLGVNVIILSFYISNVYGQKNGPTDMAVAWQGLGSTEQLNIKTMLHKNNVVLLCSFGGSVTCPTECTPTKKAKCGDNCDGCTFNYPPVSWFMDNNLDGIDLDLENFGKSGTSGTFTPCMTTLVKYIQDFRETYAAADKNCIVTSAPQSPHFSGGYGLDYSNPKFSNTFDWLNIQYYNDASGCTQNNEAWLTGPAAMGTWGACNLKYITNLGIDPTKIVVGKCGQGCTLSSAYVGAVKLEEWVKSAHTTKPYKGIMYWEWCKDCSGGPIPGAVWLTDSAPNCCEDTSTCMAWGPHLAAQSGVNKAWCTARCTQDPNDVACISGKAQECECTAPVMSYRCDSTSQCCAPSTKPQSDPGGYSNYKDCATVCAKSSPGPMSSIIIKVIILTSCLLLLGAITVFVYFKLKARKK